MKPAKTWLARIAGVLLAFAALNVEAVRQLRGECGARQIQDCEVVQYVQATPCTRSIIYTRG